ncbi:hypothetical protein UB51_06935 [Paenibacillus sp. IHBB 10380]|nr:hypothetical protein UB51_06935 [Paenibacillus sp. IHBB 10380]
MFNNNIELLNSCSDDLIFIQNMRRVYLTHPFTKAKSVKMWLDSFNTRILSINLVGSIEFLIRVWRDKVSDIDTFSNQGCSRDNIKPRMINEEFSNA